MHGIPLPVVSLCAVHSLLKSAFNTVAIEKEKIKQILSDQEQSGQSAQINTLRKSLSQVVNYLQTFNTMPLYKPLLLVQVRSS